MRTLVVGVACACIGSMLAARADMGLSEDTSRSIYIQSVAPAPTRFVASSRGMTGVRSYAAQLVVREAQRQGIDPAVALRIAKLESGFNPRARNSSTGASGILQLMPRSAEALEPGSSRNLFDPETNARVGVKHMVRCVQSGARTGDEIARCHVAGWNGWNVRLNRRAERYKHEYVALYRSTQIADASGWIVRGRGSLNVASIW